MFCLHCGTENDADSKFCKECGSTVVDKKRAKVASSGKLAPHIAEDLGASMPENPQLKRLLDMAFWHNETGSIPPAILACEAALMIEPNSTTALSLLGVLYEKQGDIQKAIDAFERVVELNPDSEADQDKLAALKRGEYLRPQLQPIQYRWLPPALVGAFRRSKGARLVAAGTVGIILFTAGVQLFRLRQNNPGPSIPQPAQQFVPASTPMPGIVAPSAVPAPPRATAAAPIARPSQPATAQSTPYTVPTNQSQSAAAMPYADRPEPPRDERQAGAYTIPPVTTVSAADPNTPSVATVRPITPTAADLINAVQWSRAHNCLSTASSLAIRARSLRLPTTELATASGLGSAQDQNVGPPPPPEHISIHVHGQSAADAVNVLPAGASDSLVSSNSNSVVSLGAQLQKRALAYEQQGQICNSAEKLYNKAIAAYKHEINSGAPDAETQRGIAACRTGIQICQQSQ